MEIESDHAVWITDLDKVGGDDGGWMCGAKDALVSMMIHLRIALRYSKAEYILVQPFPY